MPRRSIVIAKLLDYRRVLYIPGKANLEFSLLSDSLSFECPDIMISKQRTDKPLEHEQKSHLPVEN
jgi:hypothetical protein